MIVILKTGTSPEDVERAERLLPTAHSVPGGRHVLVCEQSGNDDLVARAEALDCVERVITGTGPLRLSSRGYQATKTAVDAGGVTIGGREFVVAAGPCAVETAEQLDDVATAVALSGARMLRGGAYKPRSSPYSFQGLGVAGLELLAAQRERTGLPVVTEVLDPGDVEVVAEHADMLQIGTRNMQNFTLLREAGRSRLPVLLKRGMAATVEEWLLAAEYILKEGNDQVVLCERGIRTYETATRFTLDLSAVLAVRQLSHLPVIVDPSHGSGRNHMVQPLTLAAAAVGADGVLIDVHTDAATALCDGAQALSGAEFDGLMAALTPVLSAVDRPLGPRLHTLEQV
ncbi:3-deoxy-7-phosphoheptulonate synthase [Streptomyces sp. TR1341]|uniref:3-deoxy-7-phosphoheptulonate synthase n=1 Tax=Streptomyces sp. TR1341 TaxID=2601266 RepID=UPI00138AEB36|nr:3-deoxy-7-phosphoheptulonate synthase [Streptomyces sp. TR1341]